MKSGLEMKFGIDFHLSQGPHVSRHVSRSIADDENLRIRQDFSEKEHAQKEYGGEEGHHNYTNN